MSSSQTFYSPGKLLLSAEYLILCGAEGLAVPTRFGQSMTVTRMDGPPQLQWRAWRHDGSLWFEAAFEHPAWTCTHTTDPEKSDLLLRILPLASHKFTEHQAYLIETRLEFDPSFGLGSSATFLSNFAQWAGIDAFDLLPSTFGGSGYDLAVALEQRALIFKRREQTPQWKNVDFAPNFKDDLLFVYSGQKKISREAIRNFQCHDIAPELIHRITNITQNLLHCPDVSRFEALLDEHEQLLGDVLNVRPLKQSHFPDYPGAIKSLGAWGGDFFMVTRNAQAKKYFSNKGYTIMFDWKDLIKSPL